LKILIYETDQLFSSTVACFTFIDHTT
jgi:hypothetical protein